MNHNWSANMGSVEQAAKRIQYFTNSTICKPILEKLIKD